MKIKIGTEFGKTFEFFADNAVFEDKRNGIKLTATKNGRTDNYSFASKHITVRIYASEQQERKP